MPRKGKRAEVVEGYWGFEPTRPLPVTGGLRARSQKGAFTQTWWATAWEQALLGFMDAGRLSRGKNYARRGQVVDLDIRPGQIVAHVQGSRPTPYRLRIAIEQLSDADWEAAIDRMAQQAVFSAQLLNGEMPREIVQVFDAIGVSLFPSVEADVEMTCSCPDWEVPCKHLAAVLLLVGEQLDRDPFLLFTLRGRTQEQIVRALRERRASRLDDSGDEVLAHGYAPAEDVAAAPSSPSLDLMRFWELGPELNALQVHVRAPELELEVLQVLGDLVFADDPTLQPRLAQIYRAVSAKALEVAYDEPSEEGAAEAAADDNA